MLIAVNIFHDLRVICLLTQDFFFLLQWFLKGSGNNLQKSPDGCGENETREKTMYETLESFYFETRALTFKWIQEVVAPMV